ncbi:MAG: 3-oxoacyl-[acyl-carrier protein] reductase [Kosmotogales bacterium]|nr:3-oxoacyl-[acyl-carrier protein] reductase [Kosmotogales bacterium]
MNKTAIITGGADGIGKSIFELFLLKDYNSVVIDKDSERIEDLRSKYKEKTLFFNADVSDYTMMERVFEEIYDTFNNIFVLVNNAGIHTHDLLENMSEEKWKNTININLNSVFNCSKFAVRYMKREKCGRIINISSMSAERGSYRHTHYCASKAGIVGFTKALAKEVGIYNITVNSVCPGIVVTKMQTDNLFYEKKDQWMKEMSIKRFGKPSDIANAVYFLSSEDAGWITGQSLHVNGGIVMH